MSRIVTRMRRRGQVHLAALRYGPLSGPMKKPLAILVPFVLGVASLAWGQFRGGGSDVNAHLARDDSFDGMFHYCRAVYRLNPRGDGGSWLPDHPLAAT